MVGKITVPKKKNGRRKNGRIKMCSMQQIRKMKHTEQVNKIKKGVKDLILPYTRSYQVAGQQEFHKPHQTIIIMQRHWK